MTMIHPWMKFYPSDWRADPALRMCSVAARGLWMEMLCIMHEAEPRGSLLVHGQSVSGKQLAMLAGISLKDVAGLLGELAGAGVFSREDDGIIYSRRMRRDDERSEEGRRQVTKRWGGADPNRPPNRSPPDEPITQKLEARTQKPERTSSLRSEDARGQAGAWPFDEFWERFPNKVGKQAAEKAMERVRKAGLVSFDELMAGLQRYVNKTDDRPWCNPATWLSQGRWEDKPATGPPSKHRRGFLDLARELERGSDERDSENPEDDGDDGPTRFRQAG